jgi:thiosulfate reductase/polysulfide reductase chain A
MNSKIELKMSRRNFLKVSGTAALAAAAGSGNFLGVKGAAAAVNPEDFQSKFGVCDMCFNKCSLIARVRDDVVEKLDPNPKFHKSRGMLCAKGNAGIRQLYDPDRLKTPLLKKRGPG